MRIWEGRTGKFVATLRGQEYRIAWSADGRMLISASKDSTLKVSYGLFCVWLSTSFLMFWFILRRSLENVQNKGSSPWSYR